MMAIRVNRLFSGSMLLCASLLLGACASGPKIQTRVSPTANISSYSTYGFVADPGTNRDGNSTPVTGYFKEAIQREMNARGFVYKETAPDLLVNFNANTRENVDVQSTPGASYSSVGMGYYGYRRGMYMAPMPMYSGTEIETVRYKVGTANVDVVDAAKKELVWEGLAEARLSDKAMKDPRTIISSVITEMFMEFPGRAAAQ